MLVVFFFFTNEEAFLNDGQHRDFFGNILDANGEFNFWDTTAERNGFGGNPLFWDWD